MTPRVLLSYHYYRDVDLDGFIANAGGAPVDLFADSGGFSAASVGATIELQAYATWLARWTPRLTAYANLDVIGRPEQTLENQKRLEGLGLKPIPVFHYGSDWGYLQRYVEAYPYVALGGLVGRPERSVLPWIVRAFQIARGTRCRFHGFGVTGWQAVTSFPWRSVDSSGWNSAVMFATMRLFDPRAVKIVGINLRDRRDVFGYADILRAYGGEPDKLHVVKGESLPRRTEKRDAILAICGRNAAAIEAYVSARFKAEVALYLAGACAYDAEIAAKAIRVWERGRAR